MMPNNSRLSFATLNMSLFLLITGTEQIHTYRGAFFNTSNSSSVGNGRPKTSFGLGFFFSSPLTGTDSGGLQEKCNHFLTLALETTWWTRYCEVQSAFLFFHFSFLGQISSKLELWTKARQRCKWYNAVEAPSASGSWEGLFCSSLFFSSAISAALALSAS
jgi:hypothetical protein